MKLDKKAAFRGRVFEEDSFMWKEKVKMWKQKNTEYIWEECQIYPGSRMSVVRVVLSVCLFLKASESESSLEKMFLHRGGLIK